MHQINPIEQEAIKRAFETSPDTVYAILVGLLVLAIIYLAWRLRVKDSKLIELNISTIEVLKDLNANLLLLKEEGLNASERLHTQITTTSEHIAEKIDHLKEMTYGKDP